MLHSGGPQCLNMPEALNTLCHLNQHIVNYAEAAEAMGDKAVKVGLQFSLAVYVGRIIKSYYSPPNHCAPALRVPAPTILMGD